MVDTRIGTRDSNDSMVTRHGKRRKEEPSRIDAALKKHARSVEATHPELFRFARTS